MKKILNNKGEISILLVILVLVSLFFATAYFNAIKIGYAMDEIQSNLDIAGVATLEKAINYEILKDEIYGLDKYNRIHYNGAEILLDNYENQITGEYSELLSFNRRIIRSYRINSQDVYFERSSWGTGSLGTTPQIVIETIMTFELSISRGHDYQNVLSKVFYSSKKNSSIEVLSIGSTSDGTTELVIRSTVKSIYR